VQTEKAEWIIVVGMDDGIDGRIQNRSGLCTRLGQPDLLAGRRLPTPGVDMIGYDAPLV
jgi:hypothetical protein